MEHLHLHFIHLTVNTYAIFKSYQSGIDQSPSHSFGFLINSTSAGWLYFSSPAILTMRNFFFGQPNRMYIHHILGIANKKKKSLHTLRMPTLLMSTRVILYFRKIKIHPKPRPRSHRTSAPWSCFEYIYSKIAFCLTYVYIYLVHSAYSR